MQSQAWPAIAAGQHTLLAAPTGSGKTLAAFLASIDALVTEGLAQGLPDETRVLYISPLRALSNDIQKNLQGPIAGIRERLDARGLAALDIRAWVRTSDTDSRTRNQMRRTPPHILVTTPESAFILLTSESGRRMLGTVRTVIVDEIHALAGSKRGAHLALTLERLESLTGGQLTRIGCSATQKPIERMANFLVGAREVPCSIIDMGHARQRDLALEIPSSPLEAIMANEVWEEVYDRLAILVLEHRTTLVFVNTRRLAERAAKHLGERIGEQHVTSHHGSLAKTHRLAAEQRLKSGDLKCLIATASLELGIDIGDIDLVCQLGTPRSIAAFLQRVGRSGHRIDAESKGRLFPLSRDDLVECTALLHAANHGELDQIRIPHQPLDVLSQQIVAEVSGDEWSNDDLYACFTRAWPYQSLERAQFDAVVSMLADGFSTRRGRRGAYLHHDAVNGRLRARRGARITALTNAGAIPDQFDYEVIMAPEGVRVGTLNEDFAFESMPGDIFQLGNTSYRILKVDAGRVHVQDAHGEPPTIPFWLGEAPGRTDELSLAVSELRARLDTELERGIELATRWLQDEYRIAGAAAEQIVAYLGAARAALDVIPTQSRVVMERFFDEQGSMHLVIHSPFGSRINRAWGLALRKRFCRKFNFELQAAALEDSIILSLAGTHSFPVDEPARYLHSATVRDVLTQAVLAAPMFPTHWRWNASIALAVKRNRNGKRAPAPFQRADAEDLIAVIFPEQLACAENLNTGPREIPDHPLVEQTIRDCLTEVTDADGLERVLRGIEAGSIEVIGRDLNGPSPLAREILGARPFAFLDDAPAEERRALAVQSRSFMDPAHAANLARLDPEAIERVRIEAWPDPRTPDELHDALVVLGFLTETEGRRGSLVSHGGPSEGGWQSLFESLARERRATRLSIPGGASVWAAAERLHEFALLLGPSFALDITPVHEIPTRATRADAVREILRSRLEGLGPTTLEALVQPLGLGPGEDAIALGALETEGFVMRGRYTAAATRGGTDPQVPQAPQAEEWCERRLLARIHRYTIRRLRAEIEPVSAQDYMRFLFHWHRLFDRRRGHEGLAAVMRQLEGFSAPAAAWERDILPARVEDYAGDLLDQLCASGRLVWLRLAVNPGNRERRKASPLRHSPIAIAERTHAPLWRALASLTEPDAASLSGAARKTLEVLERQGASFFPDLVEATGLLRVQLEEALGELVSWGYLTSDNYSGLRALLTPTSRRDGFGARSRRRRPVIAPSFDRAGRWSALKPVSADRNQALEHVAWALLRRYGVVFRKVLEREDTLPPWRELLRAYWRLEARGEVRGGRFVDRFAGEQFALPEAVAELRTMRRRPLSNGEGDEGEVIVISAGDPLNLAGIITPGDRVPAVLSNRVLFRDGIAVAARTGDGIQRLHGDFSGDSNRLQDLLFGQRRAVGF